MRTLLTLCLVVLSVCCPPGCKVDYTAPATQPRARTAAEKDFEAVWQASRTVLKRYRFQLDRQDRRAGVITTRPMTGMHFFELWRRDAARPVDFSESSLQTLYRTARVTVRPASAGAKTYQAQVEVLLTRSNRPKPQVTSTSEAYSLFTLAGDEKKRRQLLIDLGADHPPSSQLVPLGHDRALEAKLTAKIAAAAGG